MTTVRVTVSFNIERQQWSHVFDAERGSTIWQLKKQMLTPKGTDEDINAFELQLLSCRVPDWEQIHLDQTLEFNYLGPEEGERRAKQDMLERETSAAPASTSHDKHIIQGTPQASAPLPVGEPAVGGECVVSGGSGNDSIQALYTAAARPPTTQPAPALAQWWEVVGGADKGGILVREGRSISSKMLADRLSHGSLVEELRKEGERLHYRKLRGAGPETGWVSLTMNNKELLSRRPPLPEDLFTLDQALALQEDLMEGFAQPSFQALLSTLHREFEEQNGLDRPAFQQKRNELLLTVQATVLPKYGFAGTPAGLVCMMKAFGPYVASQEVAWNNGQLNKLLSL